MSTPSRRSGSPYQETIRTEAARMGLEVEPRHVEAWMRLEYGTLDARPLRDFRAFILETIIIERAQPGASESLAQSYAL